MDRLVHKYLQKLLSYRQPPSQLQYTCHTFPYVVICSKLSSRRGLNRIVTPLLREEPWPETISLPHSVSHLLIVFGKEYVSCKKHKTILLLKQPAKNLSTLSGIV